MCVRKNVLVRTLHIDVLQTSNMYLLLQKWWIENVEREVVRIIHEGEGHIRGILCFSINIYTFMIDFN